MNFKVKSTDDSIAIVKTGDALKDGEVFGDLKIARATVADATEARIRNRRTETQAHLLAHRLKVMNADEDDFKAWRALRDAVTTVREKDLPVEGNAG